jgi:hypothetical protein
MPGRAFFILGMTAKVSLRASELHIRTVARIGYHIPRSR